MINCYPLATELACNAEQSCAWRTSSTIGPYCEFYYEPQCKERTDVPGLETDVKAKEFCVENEKCEWKSTNTCGYRVPKNCFGKKRSKEICEENGECIFSVDDQSMCVPTDSDVECRMNYETPESCLADESCTWLTPQEACYSHCYSISKEDCTEEKNWDCYWAESLLKHCKSIQNLLCRMHDNKESCEEAHCIALGEFDSKYLCSVYRESQKALE